MARLIQLMSGIASAPFAIDKPEIRIGRAPENDVYIDDPSVSMYHCVIETAAPHAPDTPHAHYVRDLGSTNGTYVNNEGVDRRRLVHEDVIRVGLRSFKFIDEQSAEYVKTAKIKKSWIPGVYYT